MNVKQLKELLNEFPDDTEIVHGMYSDYALIDKDDWSVIEGVNQDGWIMRSHPTMSEANKIRAKKYLYLKGN